MEDPLQDAQHLPPLEALTDEVPLRGGRPPHRRVREEEQRVGCDLVDAQPHELAPRFLDLVAGLAGQGEHHVHVDAREALRHCASHRLLDLARGIRPTQRPEMPVDE